MVTRAKRGKTLSLFGGSLFFFNLAVEELLLWDCFVFSCIFHFTGNLTRNFLQVKLVVCASFTTMWCCTVDFLTANMLTLTSMGLMCLYNVNNNNNKQLNDNVFRCTLFCQALCVATDFEMIKSKPGIPEFLSGPQGFSRRVLTQPLWTVSASRFRSCSDLSTSSASRAMASSLRYGGDTASSRLAPHGGRYRQEEAGSQTV